MKFQHGTRRRALEYEKDWVNRWKEDDTFKKSVENRPADNSYVFYDGPPFITGVPHHGTLLSSIVKDAVPRYWTMKGKRVERVWGWDCHGLPAENFVEKQLNIADRRQIVTSADAKPPLDKDGNELPTITLEKYITKARESMVANSESWEGVIDRIGRWVDFKGAYRTMDKDFMESVWWAFKKLYDAGKIYEGEKVLMYDTKFATPVSKAEVTMDNDAYQTVTDPSVYVKFKLVGEDVYVLAWTTTPWTLPANLMLAVSPELTYCEVKLPPKSKKVFLISGKHAIASDEYYPKLKVDLESQGFDVTIIDHINPAAPQLAENLEHFATFDFTDAHVITHSLGAATFLKWLNDNDVKISSFTAIAPSYPSGDIGSSNADWKNKSGYTGFEIDIETTTGKIQDKPVIVYSDDLPVRNDGFARLGEQMGAEMVYEAGKGHFFEKDSVHEPDYRLCLSDKLIIAEEALERVLKDEKNKPLEYEVVRKFPGSELVGKSYEPIDAGSTWPEDAGSKDEISVEVYDRDFLKDKSLRTKDRTAVRGVVMDADGRIDLIHSKKHGYYNLPGGGVEAGETPDEAVVREVKEETGCDVVVESKIGQVTAYLQEDDIKNTSYGYVCKVSAVNDVVFTGDEADADAEIVWADSIEEAIRLVVGNNDKSNYPVARDLAFLEGAVKRQNSKIHKIYAAGFVSNESGTGIVHVAPAYGEDDFELAKANGVAAFHVIDDNGYYIDTNYKGWEVWENNKRIAKDMMERGIGWKIEYIRHEYPFNPRSKQRIMYRAIPSWFFDIQGSKPLMLEQNENINWFPEHLKHGRFAKNIEQAPDWNLSRDRFWATAMPVWRGDNGTIKVVGSYAELKELSGVELEDYHRPWVDDITFDIDGEHFTRIDKVLDGWFESGSMPFAQLHYPFENQATFEENYPADFIVEYIGQVRAWFYYVHTVNTSLAEIGAFGDDSKEPEKNAYKNVITTGVIAGNDGRKMSKSLGNFTDPNELMDKFSADSLRFLLLSSPLLNGEDFALHDKDVGDVARKLSMIWNMYDFFTMYAEVDNFTFPYDTSLSDAFLLRGMSNTAQSDTPDALSRTGTEKSFVVEVDIDKLTNPLDKWIISRVHQLNEIVTENMDQYNIPDAMSPILPFIDDASNWFVRRSRRRFWKSEDDNDKNDAYRTLHYILAKLSYILAPFTPFLAEELYHNLTGDDESIHLKDWPTNYAIDQTTLDDMARTRELINAGLSLRMKKDENQDSIKVRQPLAFASYAGEKLDEYYEQIIAEELNVKEIRHIENLPEYLAEYDTTNDKIDEASWIEVSKEITPELKREGLMREVIRHVQTARKKAGLQVDDRISFTLNTDDSELDEAINEHLETIATEVLGKNYTGGELEYTTEVKIDQATLNISLEKVSI